MCVGRTGRSDGSWSAPVYHRLHHAVEGRQEVNLGVALTVWDVLAGKARFPARHAAPCPTGLADRPVPVEQGATARRPVRLLGRQLAQPFSAA